MRANMIIRTPNTLSSLSFLRFAAIPKPFFPQPFYRRFYSPISASETSAETLKAQTPSSSQHHPWPEWVTFVDRLKSQGYLSNVGTTDYREITVVKDPCISFARDRYDLLRSLPKTDIHTLVGSGCPKLQRKVVNSAKRLREYVGLEEKSVCNICCLQGSCDRAYLLLAESEGSARMVDVMRLLLSYALDPVLVSGAGSAPSIEQAESASRRLLSLLIDLSESFVGVAPLESSEKLAYKREKSVKTYKTEKPVKVMNASSSQNIEKKNEDWTCPKCRFVNFSRNIKCRKCNEEVPNPNWGCADVVMKKGDWKCLQCGCVNFASRRDCFRCKESRPPRVLQPGEWECSKCDFLNFRRNVSCLKCGNERSKVIAWQEN